MDLYFYIAKVAVLCLFCFCRIGQFAPKFMAEWKLWQSILCESVQVQDYKITDFTLGCIVINRQGVCQHLALQMTKDFVLGFQGLTKYFSALQKTFISLEMSRNILKSRSWGEVVIKHYMLYIMFIIVIHCLYTWLFSKLFTHISLTHQNNGTIDILILEMDKL